MTPREIVDRLVTLMLEYVERRGNEPAPTGVSPIQVMFGAVQVIDPSEDPDLRTVGVAASTPWVEALAKSGFVGVVGPLATGSIGFAPSQQFVDLARAAAPEHLRGQIVESTFPSSPAVPSPASVAVAKLREELHGVSSAVDQKLLDVVLRELHDVCERDCRHASIALCGKLLELALGALLVSWNVSFAEDATLNTLISLVRGRANDKQPDGDTRAQAKAILDLGLDGLADLVRTVRNGAVHAKTFRDGGRRVELPSQEQSEGVVLLTVDLLRRFVLSSGIV